MKLCRLWGPRRIRGMKNEKETGPDFIFSYVNPHISFCAIVCPLANLCLDFALPTMYEKLYSRAGFPNRSGILFPKISLGSCKIKKVQPASKE